MPTYKWVGVNIQGSIEKGTILAPSAKQVEEQLMSQEIALLEVHCVQPFTLFKKKWTYTHTLDFLSHIAILLKAGIFLPHALTIIGDQADEQARPIIARIHNQVMQGAPLSVSMEQTHLFSPLIITLVHAGQESGKLAQALELIIAHLEQKAAFFKKVRAAATTPLITGCFFVCASFFIITFVVPHFATLFAHTNQPLPAITQALMYASDILKSPWFFTTIILTIIALFYLYHKYRQLVYEYVLRIPYISTLLIESSLVSFLETVQLLISTGIAIDRALEHAANVLPVAALRTEIIHIQQAVVQGHALSEALEKNSSIISRPEIITLIKLAEASGSMPIMIQECARLYKTRLYKIIEISTTLVQPVLMVILGICIAALLCAVYLPIFELSHTVAAN